MQDATPLTLGQEWSGYAGMLADDLERIEAALHGVYRLALGGTAVGTGINSAPGFAEAAAAEIARLTGLPFVTAPNKFTVQGAHDALVQLSGTLRTLAVSLYKIGNDIRLMSCGPRAGFAELDIPENEPGSSIMPGKVNPTQCEALTMIAVQVMANDVAVGFGGAGGYLEMNVYKPLIIFNIAHSITIMTDGCVNFRKFLVEGTKPNLKKINEYVERSLMLVTALAPVIGYDKASKIAHHAMDHDLTLKAAALQLGFVSEAEFDRVVDPRKMVAALCGDRRLGGHDAGRTVKSRPRLCPHPLRQWPVHRSGSVAAGQLGDRLGLRVRIMPRWGELQLQAEDGDARLTSAVAADPSGVDMDRVAAAMRAIEELGAGRLAPDAALTTIGAISRAPPAPTWLFTLSGRGGRRGTGGDLRRSTPVGGGAHLPERGGGRRAAPVPGAIQREPFPAALLRGVARRRCRRAGGSLST